MISSSLLCGANWLDCAPVSTFLLSARERLTNTRRGQVPETLSGGDHHSHSPHPGAGLTATRIPHTLLMRSGYLVKPRPILKILEKNLNCVFHFYFLEYTKTKFCDEHKMLQIIMMRNMDF